MAKRTAFYPKSQQSIYSDCYHVCFKKLIVHQIKKIKKSSFAHPYDFWYLAYKSYGLFFMMFVLSYLFFLELNNLKMEP